MNSTTIAILAAVGGIVGGFIVRQILLTRSQEDLESKSKEIILEAKEESLKIREEAKKGDAEHKKELDKVESQLREREASLERRMEKIESEKSQLEAESEHLDLAKKDITKLHEDQEKELASIAKMTRDEAKDRSMKEQMKSTWDAEAKEIIATAIERLATEQTAEMTVYSVHLPSDEIKGKIIGKEGRNIQAFEKATGVDLVVDETPETVTVSSFDPIRRAVAVKSLQMLIKDGRIQPAKIEEFVKKAQSQ